MAISLKKAAIINAASKYMSILLGIGFTMILARILTPEDYGVVAVTAVFTNFFAMFSDMGVSNGIIQYKKLTKYDVASIFSLTGILGGFLGLSFFAFSFIIADFYNNEVYVPLGAILAINLLFSTWNIVPNALLLKDKQFVLLAKRNVIIPFVTSVITVIIALWGMKYYALVLQSLLSVFLLFAYNWYTAREKYDLYVMRKIYFGGVRKIFGYSAYQFLFSVINYFSRNLDSLLIGRVWGAQALGFYDKAYRLMCYPNNSLTHVITPVLQPILSDYQDDKVYIYEKYIKLLKFLSLIGMFIMVFCYASAHDIIYVMFGNQWGDAVPYFEMLSLAVWAQLTLTTTGSIFQSVGDTKRLFITSCINTSIMILAILSGIVANDLWQLSCNVMIAFNVQLFVSMYILVKITLNQKLGGFICKFCIDLWMGVLLAFTAYMIESYLPNFEFLSLICRLLVLGVIYVGFCKVFNQDKYLFITCRKEG